MTQFKVGDKVRKRDQSSTLIYKGGLTVEHVAENSLTARTAGGVLGGFVFDEVEMVKPEPKFSVGQRVRTTRPIECYELEAGALGIVRRASDDPRNDYPYMVEFSIDQNAFLNESEIEPAPTQEFKLSRGDRVKNLRTGRVGRVVKGSDQALWVVGPDMSEENGCHAAAVEAYEAENAGTYDIISRGAPW